jgi:UDP-N-acetylmuramoyl-L-alanyl-D-glutamate--2,6-diaminopimelate ligase
LRGPEGWLEAQTPLLGDFNRSNLAAAAAAGLHLGLAPQQIADAIPSFTGVPGRLERIDGEHPFQVFVDFAHTPNGLRAALAAVRQLGPARLIVILGHPGGRDPASRPELARVAAEHADVIILTSDDPYDEDPRSIIDQIEAPLRQAAAARGREALREDDRRTAINRAVALARPGDAVLIAGRGHLREMVARGQSTPFDDREVALHALRRRADSARDGRPAVGP